MKKDTSQMLQELERFDGFQRFFQENQESILPKQTLSALLDELLRRHSIKKAEAIKRSELSEVYGYQIFSGLRIPDRKKLLSLCLGMELSLEEIQTLLKHAGYAQLYPKHTFDCIVIYGVYKHLTVVQINELLYDYGEETLG